MRYRIIRCRGIGENVFRNTLSVATDRLPDGYDVEEFVEWSAQYGPVPRLDGTAYKRSLAVAEAALRRRIELSPDPVILLGYSGGAHLAGNVAATSPRNLMGVVLLADPAMPKGFAKGGYGIAGARGIPNLGKNAFWLFTELDPIPVCVHDSFLRPLADVTFGMSVTDPVGWGMDMLSKLNASEWQQIRVNWLDPLSVIRQFRADRASLGRYTGGDHTRYAIDRVPGMSVTYTDLIADLVQKIARG
ncbi:hypothetical protein CH253_08235 [Rhodococcus sp. 06-156-3C]|uniref:alpha/beta fold hydrolase n=1 Tax=Rhodococcus sp. 06-156-3C TaxID=2022486 RepID=UPI000B9C6EF4|nr:alpha/beta fold hydrolase [Rhodococcus sp. 06-156-3C]OZD23841.1 hypothetical protein CH253_08235 [Rhodococcus sp. 06-156-3C]